MTSDVEGRWTTARRLLEEAAPGADNFLPDVVIRELAEEYSKPRWIGLPEFEDAEDSRIWSILRPHIPHPDSTRAVLIVDKSYAPEVGPFMLSLGEMASLAEAFAVEHADEMFGGDAIVFMPDAGSILIVHHSGVFSVVSRR